MSLPRPALLSALALLTASLACLGAHGVSHAAAPGVMPKAAPKPVNAIDPDSAPEWRALNASQKKALMPLAAHWASMDDAGRAKWVNVADRFDKLSPAEKQRVQERMDQWAKMPAQERGEARLRFQQSRQLSADQRQQKWAAYQALSQEDRQDLTRQAKRTAKPVFLADNVAGPREAKQAFTVKRTAVSDSLGKKSNVVPNASSTLTSAQTLVRPATVRASTGATTSLVTLRPTPPPHQQTGLPKIAASKGFVDPVTLLPKKGAQRAAMASLPDSASTEQVDTH